MTLLGIIYKKKCVDYIVGNKLVAFKDVNWNLVISRRSISGDLREKLYKAGYHYINSYWKENKHVYDKTKKNLAIYLISLNNA